jgi:hypothetical protein
VTIHIKPSTLKLIDEALLIQEEDAKEAGTLGFMARAMVMATLPHKNPKKDRFTRKNGNYTLSISAMAEDVGLPYGTYPRLLLAWISTEAVRTKNPELVLGKSLAGFMSELGLMPTGGRWGSITRLKDQMNRLFSAGFSCRYSDKNHDSGLNMNIVKSYDLWWEPKQPDQASLWDSTIKLSQDFYEEIIARPVPVDMRALKALKGSAMALDIYTWATWRAFTAKGKKVMIPWPLLQAQFGSDYADTKSGRYAFKKHFTTQLVKVKTVYPDLNMSEFDKGIILLPSRPHINHKPVDKSLYKG